MAGIIAGCVLQLILLASTASAQGIVFAARTEGPPAEAIVALYSVSAGHTGPSAQPPGAPQLLVPQVSGGTVSLEWTGADSPTSFVVEAGRGPGLANLAQIPVATGRTLVVPNVPAGTYYVRVRALNYVGPSTPSNEVVVVVP